MDVALSIDVTSDQLTNTQLGHRPMAHKSRLVGGLLEIKRDQLVSPLGLEPRTGWLRVCCTGDQLTPAFFASQLVRTANS
jgi:hypothetical protein